MPLPTLAVCGLVALAGGLAFWVGHRLGRRQSRIPAPMAGERELALAHGERMATLGTLAAAVAHEINNPIAFVTSSLNRLEELWQQPRDAAKDEALEILGECRDGVERVRVIVERLLSLARRSDGVDERVDLSELVESLLPLLEAEARGRARFETTLAALPAVWGDRRLLAQIVLDLALHALHAADPASQAADPALHAADPASQTADPALHAADAKTLQIAISTGFEDGSVWLVVRDDGPGLPAERLPRIFDPLPADAGPRGQGIGLAITQRLVTRHRGRIDLESGAEGTRATVELPPAGEATPS